MDKISKDKRSKIMKSIRSRDTKPELMVRKWLFSRGYRYRTCDKRLPGKPDIVLSKYKTVIFINGCFWHMHNCGKFHMPESNRDFWETKIFRNVERDKETIEKLKVLNWNVLTLWECQLAKNNFASTMASLDYTLNEKYMEIIRNTRETGL